MARPSRGHVRIRPPRPVVGGEPQTLSYFGECPPAAVLFGPRADGCAGLLLGTNEYRFLIDEKGAARDTGRDEENALQSQES